MNDDELFDAQLRKHWGAPRPAPRSLKARLLSATTTTVTGRRRWLAITAAAAVLIAVISVGIGVTRRDVSDDEVGWLVDSDDDPPDMAAYFDLSAAEDID